MVRQGTLFKGGPIGPRSNRLHVTLNPRGVILINQKLFEAMGSPERRSCYTTSGCSRSGCSMPGEVTGIRFRSSTRKILRTVRSTHGHLQIVQDPAAADLFFTQPELDHNGVLVLDMHKTEEMVSRREKRR
ncbi:MAG: hypothetical protein ABI999_09675 [Acidobacteriota bacterium]